MARIPNYTDDQGVQLNLPLIDGVSSRISNNASEMANRAFGMRGNDWMRVSEFANSMAIKRQAQRNAAEVSNAIADATLRLDELRNAQLDRKGLDAQGTPATEGGLETLSAVDDYSTNAAQIQDSIRNKLLNDVQKQKFDEWYRTRYVTDIDRVSQHQQAQLDVAEENGSQAILASGRDSAYGAIMRGEFDLAENTLLDKYGVYESTKAMQGMPEEYIKQNYKGTIYTTVKGAIDILTKNGDAAKAEAALKFFGKYLTEEQKAGLQGAVKPAITKANASDFVKTHAVYNTDGTLNRAAMYKAIEEEGTRRGKYGMIDFSNGTEQQQKVAAYIFEHAKDYGIDPYLALSHIAIETGGGFDSQLALEGNNYGGITASGVTDLPRPSEEGGYYEHYNSMEEGLDAVLKTLKAYDVDKASTVEEWNDLLLADPNAQYYTSDKGERIKTQNDLWTEYRSHGKSVGPDEEWIKDAKAAVDLLYRDNQIEIQQRDKDRSETFRRGVMDGSIATMSDAMNWCKNNNLTENETTAYGHMYRESKGILATMDKELEAAALNAIAEDVKNGKITSKAQLDNYPLTQKQKDQIADAYFNNATAWRKLEGVDGLIKDAVRGMADTDARGRAEFDLVCAVNNEIKERLRNNPTYTPTAWDVRAIIDNQKVKMNVQQRDGEFLFYRSTYETAFPRAALVQLGDKYDRVLNDDMVLLKDGNVAKWNDETKTFDIN